MPSPTAATLHALHYLQTSVASVQGTMATAHKSEGVTPALFLADLITPPLMTSSEREALTPVIIQKELDNNVQSLLGYVVRWVGQGVGCSKVRPHSLSPSPHLPHPHTSPVPTPSSSPTPTPLPHTHPIPAPSPSHPCYRPYRCRTSRACSSWKIAPPFASPASTLPTGVITAS